MTERMSNRIERSSGVTRPSPLPPRFLVLVDVELVLVALFLLFLVLVIVVVVSSPATSSFDAAQCLTTSEIRAALRTAEEVAFVDVVLVNSISASHSGQVAICSGLYREPDKVCNAH